MGMTWDNSFAFYITQALSWSDDLVKVDVALRELRNDHGDSKEDVTPKYQFVSVVIQSLPESKIRKNLRNN